MLIGSCYIPARAPHLNYTSLLVSGKLMSNLLQDKGRWTCIDKKTYNPNNKSANAPRGVEVNWFVYWGQQFDRSKL